MEVIPMMEWLMNLRTERQKVFGPACARSEVSILGIELELDAMIETPQHGVEHKVKLYEEAAVFSDMVHESPTECLIYIPISQ